MAPGPREPKMRMQALRAKTGRPFRGVELRVVDDDMNDVPDGRTGEIVIRGPAEFRKVVEESMVKNERVVKAVGLTAN